MEVAHGRGDKNPASFHVSEIETATADTVTWAQCYGIGSHTEPSSTRLAVRQGPILRMALLNGRDVLISTPDPQAALTALSERPTP